MDEEERWDPKNQVIKLQTWKKKDYYLITDWGNVFT